MDLFLHPTLICLIEEPIESILISHELILISHELHRRLYMLNWSTYPPTSASWCQWCRTHHNS